MNFNSKVKTLRDWYKEESLSNFYFMYEICEFSSSEFILQKASYIEFKFETWFMFNP